MESGNIVRGPFVICKAAAGSGKTFNLVKEYLKLALGGGLAEAETRFRGILAITFTNKAANEMKSRIMDFLDQIAEHGVDTRLSGMGQPLMDAINEQRTNGLPPVDEALLKRMAARLRAAILHRYSDLSVCTIDSFMHRIVRTFAHDLDQPVNFEVTVEKDDLIEQAVSGLMALVGTPGNEDLTEVVQHFSESRMEDDKGFDITHSLSALAVQLFSEGTEPYLRQLANYTLKDYIDMHRRYGEDNRRYEQLMRALGKEALRLLASAGMGVEQCNRGKTGFYTFFSKVAAGTFAAPNRYVVEVFGADDYGASRLCKAKTTVSGADAIAAPLREVYRQIVANMGDPLTDYNTRSLLIGNLYSMALLGELDRQLHACARDNEMLHLSDFNKLINKIVQEEPAPFIYERLGSRYHHYLIDEFQDTSVLQWQNLVPLLEGGVSEGRESLVVGDGKQAIYRFRQGDVRQFVALPQVEGMTLHGAALSQPGNYRVENLGINYRTADEVVRFNNDFFSWLVRNRYGDNELARRIYLGPDPDVAEGYEELRQGVNEKRADRPDGHVGIRFVDPDDPEEVCAQVHEIINDLIENHGYAPGDIMVLGRTARDLARVGSYLLEHGRVEQSSAESFYLRSSEAVQTLVAALRCLYDVTDRPAAAELLALLETLGIIASRCDEAFLSEEPVDLQEVLASQGVEFSTGRLLTMDLYDCCEELVRSLRLDGIDLPYVASLLGRVAAFTARHRQGVGDFLDWWDGHPDLSVAATAEGNAVRLMTIHKAKGLEAPVVICPFFNPRQRPSGQWVDVADRFAPYDKSLPAAYVTLSKDTPTRFDPDRDREQESRSVDDLNILYVAFTRPREQLFVVCPTPSGEAQTYARMLYDYTRGDADYGNADFMHQGKPAEQGERCKIQKLTFADWTERVMIASPSERALTPLIEERIRFGIHAHTLLSLIEDAHGVDAAVARFSQQEKVEGNELQRLSDLANAVVQHPDTARFFDPSYEAKRECTLTAEGELLRPDRVVITPDETWVVDFKTGGDMPDEYDHQLRQYCHALQGMGYPNVTGYLIFFSPTLHVRKSLC